MRKVVEALEDRGLSMSWLARELELSRQTISSWDEVPVEYLPAVSTLVGLSPAEVRPDLAKLMAA